MAEVAPSQCFEKEDCLLKVAPEELGAVHCVTIQRRAGEQRMRRLGPTLLPDHHHPMLDQGQGGEAILQFLSF